ncbi:AAA family ATPase [Campylobacter sp. IFREMER_LSEM_CL2127]|uniref:AAA family ATPase n=1 Tax=unclassified Campylobacter TaxID=2593542 RepID=UPI0021E63AA3|nr:MULTISPECIES: AAA family ATPase [unclassified Campylobacter]MCV3381163.1 AAA family ATPase [Campylobacter sp. IFREMER_LSEM_CL2127]MCV3482644.1 AAA family ATPase [Campylobacter sp. CNRCH_2014_0184h]
MNVVEFHFSNENKIQAQIENSNEKIFRIFLEKRLKTVNQYINTAKYAIKECKRLNIVNRDDFDTFQINSMEVLTNLSFELKDGLLQEYNFKSGKGCPHACINSHYLEFVKYVNAYKNYVSKDMVKYLKTRGGEKEFKVEIKNQKIEVITSADAVELYSLNRFLEYSVLSKNEDDLYAKPLFEDILSSSNLSAIKQSENEKFYKEQYFENEKLPNENQNLPLNQILYGPPGTGKTYHTIDKALEIISKEEKIQIPSKDDRINRKKLFDEYVKNGQIVFTTFHQSYGYEEFVEGIKPEFDKKELKYKVKPGIFKKICNKALDKEIKIATNEDIYIDRNSKVWKISLGANASLRSECFEKNKICIGWSDIPKNKDERFLNLGSNDKNSIISFVEYMQIGDLVCVFNTSTTIKGIGVITSDVEYSEDEEYQTYREVKWISKDNEINILDLNSDKILVQKTVYELYRINPNDLLEKIKSSNLNDLKIVEDNTKKNFIIIIDEINRGNVSKIFGELITLIEPSKRIGAEEELKVTLPYSKDEFGVPKNVYIIGTMNTADRSITSLDTALRRRFEFVEMMPKLNVLSDNCKGVNLQKLLEFINTRIEYLLDREKTIGHAFFIGVDSLEKLKNVFQNKIIPLLQEYFYNDYALIDAVLNKNGMLEKQDINSDYLKNMTDFIESDKVIYKFSDSQKWDEATFKKIYE